MADLKSLANNSVFAVEHIGDTLIIRPLGTIAGFGHTLVSREAANVEDVLRQPECRNAILDFGSGNYFGSDMLGIFASMRKVVVEQGGKFAACNASKDMMYTIQTMKLDQLWEIYPTQSEAMKKVVSISTGQMMARHKGKIILSVIAAAVVLVMVFVPKESKQRLWHLVRYSLFSNGYRDDYNTLLKVCREMEKAETGMTTHEERVAMSARLLPKVEAVLSSYRRSKHRSGIDDRMILAAESIKEKLTGNASDPTLQESKLVEHMEYLAGFVKVETGAVVERLE